MMSVEAAAFEVTTAFAGCLGTVPTAAHTAVLTVCSFTFVSFPFAVATAASIRVGNLVGANKPRSAALSGRICITIGTVFQSGCGIAMVIFKRNLVSGHRGSYVVVQVWSWDISRGTGVVVGQNSAVGVKQTPSHPSPLN